MPFNQAGNLGPILEKIETYTDFRVSVQLTSLETAYIRIVEDENKK
jgi:hypothetical protein